VEQQPDRVEGDHVKVICKSLSAAVHAREKVDGSLSAIAAHLEVAEAAISKRHQTVAYCCLFNVTDTEREG